MRKMKRFVSAVIMAAMVGTLCLTGCGSDKSAEGSTGSKSGKQVTVAVVQPMSHTSLDQIRDTITSELGKDENIKVVTDNANGTTSHDDDSLGIEKLLAMVGNGTKHDT